MTDISMSRIKEFFIDHSTAVLAAIIFFMLSATMTFFGVGTLIFEKFGYISPSQLMFHLTMPLDRIKADTFVAELRNLLLLTTSVSAVAAILITMFCHWLKKRKAAAAHLCWQIFFILSSLTLIISIYYFNDYLPLRSLWYFADTKSEMIDENFYSLKPADITFPEKRNCIVIMLESMEKSFSIPSAVGRNMIPGLSKLQEKNLSFDRNIQCNGTTWTLAALVNVFYGIPQLPLHGSSESNSRNRRIFHIPSIFDFFLNAGYNCEYIQGGHMEFAGKERLFANLPEVKVLGFDELSEDPLHRRNPDPFEWGVDDKVLFAGLRTECRRLADLPEPFFLTALTIDTHFPGYLRPGGSPIPKGEFFSEILRRTDENIIGFISWVKSQDFGKNTVIILIGDHLSMSNELMERLLKYHGDDLLFGRRQTYNCIVDPAREASRSGDRIFATFDWMPTILHAAGAKWGSDKLHLGVSLFGSTPTLLEKYGVEHYESETLKKSDKYLSLFTL